MFSQWLCIINSVHVQIHFYISEIKIFTSADGHNAMNIFHFDMFITEAVASMEPCKSS